MDTTTWCKEEKPGKVGMVEMTAASVNPWAMVVHLHYTSVTERRAKIFFPCPENIVNLDLLASLETNLSNSHCFQMLTIYAGNKKFTLSKKYGPVQVISILITSVTREGSGKLQQRLRGVCSKGSGMHVQTRHSPHCYKIHEVRKYEIKAETKIQTSNFFGYISVGIYWRHI